jgi:mRNA interferase YafQ
MAYEIERSARFKKAYKRVRQLPGFKEAVFIEVVDTLATGQKLPTKYKDHKLTGNLKDFRECHIAPDILLIYQIDSDMLILMLVNIGNHSQLFK